MRWFLAALALAGMLTAAVADDRYPLLAQGASASDVTRAKRCAPPFGCTGVKRAPRSPRPPAPDYRSGIAALIDSAARAQGLAPAIARALVRVESGFNPHMRGRAGEWGLTQIKCQTARGLGFAGGCAALADPAINLRFGLKHAQLAVRRGSIGFHQAGLGARRVSAVYVAKIHAAMR